MPSEKEIEDIRAYTINGDGMASHLNTRYVLWCDYTKMHDAYLAMKDERDKYRNMVDMDNKALSAIDDLMHESFGVAGLHRNGDIATWGELCRGGRFEEWLLPVAEAMDLRNKSNRLPIILAVCYYAAR